MVEDPVQTASQGGAHTGQPSFPPQAGDPSFGQPVHYLPADAGATLEDGIALCLSGGGYRAMLFHTGVIWRLNELGVLQQLKRISSVSGGSIIAATVASKWDSVVLHPTGPNAYEDQVVSLIRRLASRTIDVPAIIKGSLWFGSIGHRLAEAYRRYLFDQLTLQDLPDEPRFVFNATSLQTGVLWRFEKPYMADYRVGEIKDPLTPLATAVAASSAFPPLLSPVTLDLRKYQFEDGTGTDCRNPRFRKKAILTDGGVYDNLGLETVWKRYKSILVSDGGQGFQSEVRPKTNWLCHTLRVLLTIDNQVRALRRRQVIDSFVTGSRTGAFWGIDSDARNFPVKSPFIPSLTATSKLARVKTRLKSIPDDLQERLINWGYAAADLGYRSHVDPNAKEPTGLPYPVRGI